MYCSKCNKSVVKCTCINIDDRIRALRTGSVVLPKSGQAAEAESQPIKRDGIRRRTPGYIWLCL